MNTGLHLVSPLSPPMPGGLSDHTDCLLRHLAASRSVRLITSAGCETNGCAREIFALDRWGDLELLKSAFVHSSKWPVLWQYVPHMYGRGGVNSSLVPVMQSIRESGRRQVVIAHEIAAPYSLWPHRAWYALQHRRQWSGILRQVDSVGFSTEAWVEPWGKALRPDGAFFLAPSPSNIPVVQLPPQFRENWCRKHGLGEGTKLLVWFGTMSGAKQFDWMISAWQAVKASGIPVALVALGASPALPPGIGSAGFVAMGHQPPDEVSRVLQIADVVGLPFVDGVSERRGSFTAALSHGCPVVGTLGSNTGPSLRASDDFVGVEAAFGREAFVAAVKQLFQSPTRCVRLRHRAKMIYASRYDWPVLVHRLEDALFKS